MSNKPIVHSLSSSSESVKILSSGVQIFFPLTEYLEIGLFFVPPIGRIKFYLQQKVLTEDFLLQAKMIEIRVPVTLALLLFHLGLAHFYSKSIINLVENIFIKRYISKEVQGNLEEALKKLGK
jgi:hypothetical protein